MSNLDKQVSRLKKLTEEDKDVFVTISVSAGKFTVEVSTRDADFEGSDAALEEAIDDVMDRVNFDRRMSDIFAEGAEE